MTEKKVEQEAEVEQQEVSDEAQAGADQQLADQQSSKQFGDLTSSSAGANNPGQHGRDGGEIAGSTNNPAPSEPEEDAGEAAEQDEEAAEPSAKADAKKEEPKKL